MRQRAGQPVSPDTQNDDDLKLLAIQGLQHTDPAQAVPLLEKILQGTQSPRLKERALFVLAQSGSPRAQQVIAGCRQGQQQSRICSARPFNNRHGRQRGEPAAARRTCTASSDANADIKRQILRSFMMAGDKQRVLAAATSEKSPELVRKLSASSACWAHATSCGSSIRRNRA